jgi:hypothetical protein
MFNNIRISLKYELYVEHLMVIICANMKTSKAMNSVIEW